MLLDGFFVAVLSVAAAITVITPLVAVILWMRAVPIVRMWFREFWPDTASELIALLGSVVTTIVGGILEYALGGEGLTWRTVVVATASGAVWLLCCVVVFALRATKRTRGFVQHRRKEHHDTMHSFVLTGQMLAQPNGLLDFDKHAANWRERMAKYLTANNAPQTPDLSGLKKWHKPHCMFPDYADFVHSQRPIIRDALVVVEALVAEGWTPDLLPDFHKSKSP